MSELGKLITVKIGSSVITGMDGLPDQTVIESIAGQVAQLQEQGYRIMLISSGAVAAGRSIFQAKKIEDTIEKRQVLSAMGQVELMMLYKKAFDRHGLNCSQVLVTKEDFKSRTHYLNMKNCLTALLKNSIIPVINENDVVSITELMFTDNDELAGLVSAMMNTTTLIILTSVDGIYDRDPGDPNAVLVKVFDGQQFTKEAIIAGKQSEFGRGGVLTKCDTASKIAGMGIPVYIANGKTEQVLVNITTSTQPPGTFFPPSRSTSNIKKYIAHAYDTKGKVIINEGARNALTSAIATSLLPVGIVRVVGDFQKGDVIRVVDESGHEIGLGLTKVDAKKANEIQGKSGEKPLIHYDHLYLH